MNEGTLGLYVEKLVSYRPEYVHGYPSAIEIFAEYILRHNLGPEIPPIRAALLGSEACSQIQRDRIAAAFRARVYTWYGQSEKVLLGGECESSQAYHAFPAYGVLEILREDGTPCDIGEQGEIVGTGFLNRSMPLIRYRTDDQATREPCECECGRRWDRFSNVLGRRSLEGFLIGRKGSRMSAAALDVRGTCFDHVIRYQYYQQRPGQLVVRVIPNSMYSAADERDIIVTHEKKLWNEMNVVVQRVDDIALTVSGKQRRFVCEIGLPGRGAGALGVLETDPAEPDTTGDSYGV
jgi:phenylacetate-CoA ligase